MSPLDPVALSVIILGIAVVIHLLAHLLGLYR